MAYARYKGPWMFDGCIGVSRSRSAGVLGSRSLCANVTGVSWPTRNVREVL
jgi:hypothetical protein